MRNDHGHNPTSRRTTLWKWCGCEASAHLCACEVGPTTSIKELHGLEEGIIPIEPMSMTMEIRMRKSHGKAIRHTVHRRQFPITAAYAFTDFRAQGQTIPAVLVDIASPPSFKLSLFNLYVALSRSSGRDAIRLLRDFDASLFLQPHGPIGRG
jgi:hypothetical protein